MEEESECIELQQRQTSGHHDGTTIVRRKSRKGSTINEHLKYGKVQRMKWIERSIGFMMNSGYYAISKPGKWDFQGNPLIIPRSKWHLRIRILFTTLCIFSTTSQIYVLTRDLSNGTINMNEFTTLARLALAMICGFNTFFQVHTAFRHQELNEFGKLSLTYVNLMQKHKMLKSPAKFDISISLLIGFLGMVCVATGLAFLILSLFNCKVNNLSGVLPFCQDQLGENGRIVHGFKSTPWKVFSILSGIFFITQHVTSAFVYIPAVTIPVFGCMVVLSHMKEALKSPLPNFLQDDDTFLTHYRILQMLFERVNICLGEYIVPYTILMFMVLFIILNYIFIVVDFQPVMMYFVFVYLTIVLFFYVVVRQAIFLSDTSLNVISERKALCKNSRGKHCFALQLKTCRPLRLKAGSFFYLHRLTLFEIIDTCFQSTVNLLLTFHVE